MYKKGAPEKGLITLFQQLNLGKKKVPFYYNEIEKKGRGGSKKMIGESENRILRWKKRGGGKKRGHHFFDSRRGEENHVREEKEKISRAFSCPEKKRSDE